MYTFPIWFFSFLVILISFDALQLLFSPVSTSVYRKGLPMRSLQVSQHTDILQTQWRFYLLCYSTRFQHLHNTSYFQELTQKKISFIFKYRTWTPFPASNPPGKILQSQALLFPLLRRFKEHWEMPRLPGEGAQVEGETHLKVLIPYNLHSIPHCTVTLVCVSSLNSLTHLLKCNNKPQQVCPRVVTVPKHTQACHHRTRKVWLQLPTRTIAIFTSCDGIS